MEYVVRVEGVAKRYGTVQALSDVSLQVPAGSVFGILGPNGAGKTTLLRALLGLTTIDSGEITIAGGAPGSAASLTRIGALIEASAFIPGLTGAQNLTVLSKARGLPTRRVAEVLATVGLSEAAGRKFQGYSLGMKQRLGVAAALLPHPELIILDEPSNGLDPQGIADMRNLVKQLAGQGMTVLFSSHVLVEVERVCDYVAVLRKGEIATIGTVEAFRGTAKNQPRAYSMTATPAASVRKLLTNSGHRVPPTDPADNTWDVTLYPEQVPAMVRSLVSAHIDVHQIAAAESDFETSFFSASENNHGGTQSQEQA